MFFLDIFALNKYTIRMENVQDKIKGCLLVGAAGDALGYAVEFCSEKEILSRYGESGITEYRKINGFARISDDTQMTMFTASGLLDAIAQGKTDVQDCAAVVHVHYLDWLKTQYSSFPQEGSSYLMGVQELYAARAPGNTCLSALESGGRGTTGMPINRSKGCGGVMRVAPVGLIYDGQVRDEAYIGALAAEIAAITHGHPLGYLPAAVLAIMVARLVYKGDDVESAACFAMNKTGELFGNTDEMLALKGLLLESLCLAKGDDPDLESIHELGEGWVAEEALAIALYAAKRYETDLKKALICSVNHRGDSDSTGAICGNILGAKLGLQALPLSYRDDLELYGTIEELAEKMIYG